MRIISGEQVERVMDMQRCIGLMKEALTALSGGPRDPGGTAAAMDKLSGGLEKRLIEDR